MDNLSKTIDTRKSYLSNKITRLLPLAVIFSFLLSSCSEGQKITAEVAGLMALIVSLNFLRLPGNRDN